MFLIHVWNVLPTVLDLMSHRHARCIYQRMMYVLKQPVLIHIHRTINVIFQLKQNCPGLHVCLEHLTMRLIKVTSFSLTILVTCWGRRSASSPDHYVQLLPKRVTKYIKSKQLLLIQSKRLSRTIQNANSMLQLKKQLL